MTETSKTKDTQSELFIFDVLLRKRSVGKIKYDCETVKFGYKPPSSLEIKRMLYTPPELFFNCYKI